MLGPDEGDGEDEEEEDELLLLLLIFFLGGSLGGLRLSVLMYFPFGGKGGGGR